LGREAYFGRKKGFDRRTMFLTDRRKKKRTRQAGQEKRESLPFVRMQVAPIVKGRGRCDFARKGRRRRGLYYLLVGEGALGSGCGEKGKERGSS